MKFLLTILSILTIQLTAAQNPYGSKFRHQLDLIDSLKVFITKELKLDIPDDFYTKWAKANDSMYLYVYAANANRIVHGDTSHRSPWYFTDEDSARTRQKQLIAKGYHTLLYRTAGTSDAALTPKLLSYPDEAIAFIVIHEAVHNHIRNNEKYKGYPYVYEESLCDAVATIGCAALARKGILLEEKAVAKQQRVLERCYALLNKKRVKLDSTDNDFRILKRSNKRIDRLTLNGNQFQQDRLRYVVNNAYFLRVADYSLHYFELKEKLYHLSVTDVVKQVMATHVKAK